jgi:predicted patatin/cPLA2 family phospholipase
MVWGAIWRGGKSNIIILTRDPTAKQNEYTSWSYQKALSEGLLHIYHQFRRFQQDNAKIHVSASTGFLSIFMHIHIREGFLIGSN